MDLTVLALLTLLAGLVHGLTGFGYGLTLVAVLLALGYDTPTTVLIANITALFCQAVVMYRLRGKAALGAVWTLLLGAALTVPAGVVLLGFFGKAPLLRRLFGLFVTAVALWLLAAPKRPQVRSGPQRLLGFGAGILAGLANGMFNTGGPFSVLYTYTRPISLDSAKATVQWIFVGVSVYRLALVTALLGLGRMPSQGQPNMNQVFWSLTTVPLVVAGTLGGLAMSGRIHPDRLRKAVFVLLVLIGLKSAIWP